MLVYKKEEKIEEKKLLQVRSSGRMQLYLAASSLLSQRFSFKAPTAIRLNGGFGLNDHLATGCRHGFLSSLIGQRFT